MASAPAISAAAMMRGMLRYDSRAGAGPMHTSSSANRTCSDSRSASEYTATVWMPSSRQARITRSAISPRLAIRIFLNNGLVGLDYQRLRIEKLTAHCGLTAEKGRQRAESAEIELAATFVAFEDFRVCEWRVRSCQLISALS